MLDLFWSAEFDLAAWLWAGLAVLAFAVAGWLLSLVRKDVSFVDSMWSLMFLLALSVYLASADSVSWRAGLVFGLVSVWALRLAAHITWRNHGQGEDRRYQKIRSNNQPNFELKSLYIVFGLQAVLAWVICLPALAAVSGQTPPGPLDYIGITLWLIGMFFEVVSDLQLARFRSRKSAADSVLDSGLWRYTRHPNYFGEFTLWWGIYLLALSAGAGWTVVAPSLLSFLLLRVSGVALLEKDIGQRRPDYRNYIRRTNAFFPGKPRIARINPVSGTLVPWLLILLPAVTATPSDSIAGTAGSSEVIEASAQDRTWRFRVYVDDRHVGFHEFHLRPKGADKVLSSKASFEYKLAFITLYRYQHEATETWSGDCLVGIEASTNSNGRRYEVSGQLDSDAFIVSSNRQDQALPACVMSFAYWNPDFLQQGQLLNSQDGEYMEVQVSEPRRTELQVRGDLRPAWLYRLNAGPLTLSLWYSDEREWLALESETESGRTLRYELL